MTPGLFIVEHIVPLLNETVFLLSVVISAQSKVKKSMVRNIRLSVCSDGLIRY